MQKRANPGAGTLNPTEWARWWHGAPVNTPTPPLNFPDLTGLHQQAGEALQHAGKQLRQVPPQLEFGGRLGMGAGSGLAAGMTAGAPLGALIGMGRGNTAEGLGRGLIRGGATGLGFGAGGAIGQELGAAIDPKYRGLGGLLGSAAGAGLGYMGSGAILGDPEAERRKREVAHGAL